MNNLSTPVVHISTNPAVITHEKQQENSIKRQATPASWKPGQSGNPNGRPPKGHSISEAVKHMLTERPEIKKQIIDKIADAAKLGDMVAIKLIWNYMDGMPNSRHELTGKDGQPLYPQPILGSEAPKE